MPSAYGLGRFILNEVFVLFCSVLIKVLCEE